MTVPPDRDRAPILAASLRDDLAYRDELTGLYNRRVLDHLERHHWPELTAQGAPLSLVLVDLDLFKEVNDTYGHLAGDRILRATADALRDSFRRRDIAVRYGGDEFLVILPGAGEIEAQTLAERAREALSSQHHTADEAGGTTIDIPVSFSLGRATHPADGVDLSELMATADERLYAEKEKRRPHRTKYGRALTIGLFGLLLLILGSSWWSRSEPAPTPVVEATEDPTVNDGATAHLERQIAALEESVRTLRAALTAERESPEASADRARIDALEATITRLREDLQRRNEAASPPPEPTSVPLPEPTQSPPAEASTPPAGSSETPDEPGLDLPAVPIETPTPREIVLEPPRLRDLAPPDYPRRALELRREATLRFEVVVAPDGSVLSARALDEPAGFGFDQAAHEAALAARYSPGTRDGVATEMTARLSIQFRLD